MKTGGNETIDDCASRSVSLQHIKEWIRSAWALAKPILLPIVPITRISIKLISTAILIAESPSSFPLPARYEILLSRSTRGCKQLCGWLDNLEKMRLRSLIYTIK